jgi:hypothetical protein
MKKLIRLTGIFYLMFGMLAAAMAADPTFGWEKKVTSPTFGSGMDHVKQAVSDGTYVYVLGTSEVTESRDIILAKYNVSNSQLVWKQRFNSGLNEWEDAGALVIGTDGVYFTVSVPQFIIVKYSTAGVRQWVKRFDPGVTASNGSKVLGMGTGTASGESEAVLVTVSYYAGLSGTAFRTYKYFSDGTAASGFPVTHSQQVTAMTVGSTGNFYVTGTKPRGSYVDIYTTAYTATGSQLGVNEMVFSATTTGASAPSAVAVDSAGNVYITGSAQGSGTGSDYLTVKYTKSINNVWTAAWTKWFDGAAHGNDQATGLVVDSSGNVYVTGVAKKTTVSSVLTTIKYDSSGNQVWSNNHGDVSSDQLTAYWKMDETGSNPNRADNVGGNTLTSTASPSGTGKIGNAATFTPSSSSGLQASDAAGLSMTPNQGFTISCWIKLNTVVGTGAILSKSGEYALVQEGTKLRVRIKLANTSADFQEPTAIDLSSGVWYNVVILSIPNGNNHTLLRMFVNGQLARPDLDRLGITVDGPDPFTVGSPSSFVGSGYYFNGSVDELAIWKRVLSDDEAVALYNRGTGLSYPFDSDSQNSPNIVSAAGIALSSGNVVVGGVVQQSSGSKDFVVAAYSTSGSSQFGKTYDDSINGDDVAMTVLGDGTGGAVVVGDSESTSRDQGFATKTSDYKVAHFNSSGTLASENSQTDGDWEQKGNERITAMTSDSAGNVYVAGQIERSRSTPTSADYDYFIAKYDSAGLVSWPQTIYDLPGSSDRPTDISVNSAGECVVTGWGNGGILTLKYNRFGTFQWAQTDYDLSYYTRVALAPNGNVYLLDNGKLKIRASSNGSLGTPSSYSGTRVWPSALAVDSNGDLYVAGLSTINGGTTMAVAKYRPSGNPCQELWFHAFKINNTSFFPGVGSIVLDLLGNVQVGVSYSNYGADDVAVSASFTTDGKVQWYQEIALGFHPGGLAVDNGGNLFVSSASTGSENGGHYNFSFGKYHAMGSFMAGASRDESATFDYDLALALAAKPDGTKAYLGGEAWAPNTLMDYATVAYTFAVNSTPMAYDQTLSISMASGSSVRLGAADAEDSLTYTIVQAPAHGSLSGTAPNLTYTPSSPTYAGADFFTFKVNDGHNDSRVAIVKLLVTPLRVPAAVIAQGGVASVRVLWSDSPGATSYNVKRSTSDQGPFSTIGTTTDMFYTDATVVNGTTYYYVVSALVGTTSGTDSSPPASATPQADAFGTASASATGSASGTYDYQINISGAPSGATCQIFTSTDLGNWTSLGSITLSGTSGTYTHANASWATSQRYYRVKTGSTFFRNIFGFAKISVPVGYTMLANPFITSANNTLASVFQGAPLNSQIYKYNEVTNGYDPIYVKTAAGWAQNGEVNTKATLNPGEGAFFYTPTAGTLTLAGDVPSGPLSLQLPTGSSIGMRSFMIPQKGDLSAFNFPVGPLDAYSMQRYQNGSYLIYAYEPEFGGWDLGEPMPINSAESFWVTSSSNPGNIWKQRLLECRLQFGTIGSGYQINIEGPANAQCKLQASDDLQTWTDVSTITVGTAGTATYTDYTSSTSRAYRLAGDYFGSINAIGATKVTVPGKVSGTGGQALIGNQYKGYPNNALATVVTGVPNGTGLTTYDDTGYPQSVSYDASTGQWKFSNGGVDTTTTIPLGYGAILQNPSATAFTVVLKGEIQQGPFSIFVPDQEWSLRTYPAPIGGTLPALGFPAVSCSAIYFNKTTQSSTSFTYTTSYGWSPYAFTLGVGESFYPIMSSDEYWTGKVLIWK